MAPGRKKDKKDTVKASKYNAVVAERDQLQRLEVNYKNRIEQLEDSYRNLQKEKENLRREPVDFVNVPYELVVTERDNLLEAEKGYKRSIEQLKKEHTEALANYAILYSENKHLRARLGGMPADDEADEEPFETLSSIRRDRDHLRDAEKATARRVKELEREAVDMLKSYNHIYGENKLLRTKVESLENKANQVSHVETLRLLDLEQEHEDIESRLTMFKKDKQQLEERLDVLEKENKKLRAKLAEEERGELKQEQRLKIKYLENERAEMKHKIDEFEKYNKPKAPRIIREVVKSKEDDEKIMELQAQLIALQLNNKDLKDEMMKLKHEHVEKLKQFQKITIDRSTNVRDSDFPDFDMGKLETIKKLERDVKEYKTRYEFVQKETKALERDLTQQEKKFGLLERENAKLVETVEDQKKEMAELTSFMYRKRDPNDELENLKYKLRDVVAEKQALIGELRQEKKLAKSLLKEANDETEKANRKVKEMEKQLRDFTTEMKILHDDTNKLLKTNESQSREVKRLRSQLEQVNSLLETRSGMFDKMKKDEQTAQKELKETVELLTEARAEIQVLKSNKTLGRLAAEMQSIKMDRQEEADQLRDETTHLREEVKRLKVFEKKMFTLEAEVRRLLKLRKVPEIGGGKPIVQSSEKDRKELLELRRKLKDVEKEKWEMLKEKRAWEITKGKYVRFQIANRRLGEENKRLRGEVDETQDRAIDMEMKLKSSQVRPEQYKDKRQVQLAQYVDKDKTKRERRPHARVLPEVPAEKKRLPPLTRPRSPRFSTRASATKQPKFSPGLGRVDGKARADAKGSKLLAKKPILPGIGEASSPVGKESGYTELHRKKDRYKSKAVPLALL